MRLGREGEVMMILSTRGKTPEKEKNLFGTVD
jgi:hypothetical protein